MTTICQYLTPPVFSIHSNCDVRGCKHKHRHACICTHVRVPLYNKLFYIVYKATFNSYPMGALSPPHNRRGDHATAWS